MEHDTTHDTTHGTGFDSPHPATHAGAGSDGAVSTSGAAVMLTVNEAAQRCGRSTETIRRRLADGALPGAVQVGAGRVWRIPEQDLVRAGLVPRSAVAVAGGETGANAEDVQRERNARMALLEASNDDLRATVRDLRCQVELLRDLTGRLLAERA